VTDRISFINGLLGKPWRANAKGPDAYDCWHLAVVVEDGLFGRTLPAVVVPDDPSWEWMISTIDAHPERKNWTMVPCDAMGLVKAKDGALVLMARRDQPAHIGVWLRPESRIIHADPDFGVVCESKVELNAKAWHKLRFFDPR
jgi:hypothetical protein